MFLNLNSRGGGKILMTVKNKQRIVELSQNLHLFQGGGSWMYALALYSIVFTSIFFVPCNPTLKRQIQCHGAPIQVLH